MDTIGQIIRLKRESLGLYLRQVAAYLDIDQAILSKIERNERKLTKENIVKLAEILELDKDELMVQFMSEKIAYQIFEENSYSKILRVAESKIEYLKKQKSN